MALSFQYRSPAIQSRAPERLAILPGAWNPPTVAHLAMAHAALEWAGEVVLVLPRAFPHKGFEGVSFTDRLDMLCTIAAAERGISVASAEGGLYAEMAGEAQELAGSETEIGLVCGRDAAERIAGWDYGRPGVFEEMLARYPLLVAGRAGEYVPSPRHAHRVVPLTMPPSFDDISSTEIRRRIRAGEPWQHLIPSPVVSLVARLYVP
jgi:nicotinate-nucleotide adenylyltransferase